MSIYSSFFYRIIFIDLFFFAFFAGNINSEDSSKSTPKKKKGHSELLEKSPVTPPDVLHDKERGKGAKKAKKNRSINIIL
jgi:hypothetical protein